MSNGAIQRALSAAFSVAVMYKAIAVFLVAVLLHRLMLEPHKRQVFPAWATVEIAATGYIITRGRVSRRI